MILKFFDPTLYNLFITYFPHTVKLYSSQKVGIHYIIPVYKSGEKFMVNNYWPISLLCSVSKVLERLVYNQIIDFVAKSISYSQFGFLPNRSALQKLLTMLNPIIQAVNSYNQVACLYLDLKKAFHSVPHIELLTKLWSAGITGNLWKWFLAYLTQWNQCVAISGTTS